MQYSDLGNTGLKVSRLALGTVELGMDYGFRGSSHYKKPNEEQATRVIHRALELGINFIDTARIYGDSEEILGRALLGKRGQVVIASKVAINSDDLDNTSRVQSSIAHSIELSLRALQTETIDLLLIHNAQPKILANEFVLRTLENAQKSGKIRAIGASCVGEESAQAALSLIQMRALMLPLNILDRQMLPSVLPKSEDSGVGVLARSAFLRGVLTDNLPNVPDTLLPLKQAAARVAQECTSEVQSLSELALRYCLSFEAVSTVVIGVRSLDELQINVRDADRGALSQDCIRRLSTIEIPNQDLVTPGTWQGLI